MLARYNLKLRFIVQRVNTCYKCINSPGKTDDTKSTVTLKDSPDNSSRGVKRSNEPHPTAVKKVNVSRKISEENKFIRQLSEVCSKEDCKKSSNCL